MNNYLECGKCGKHSIVKLNGTPLCPHCGANHAARMVVGRAVKPDWFNESQLDGEKK